MRLREVAEILAAETLWGDGLLDREVDTGVASDLMSDALTYAGPRMVLLTGLTNPQVIRIAELTDCCAVVFVRGKRPADGTVRTMAEERRIPLLSTGHSMFDACALLHAAGLKGARTRDDGA